MKLNMILRNAALMTSFAAAFVGAPSVQAAVVIRNLTAAPINITDDINGLYLNVVTGVSGGAAADVQGWDMNPYRNVFGLTFFGNDAPYGTVATGEAGNQAVASALRVGDLVLPTLTGNSFYNEAQTQGTEFRASSGINYLGFRFLNEATGATNYGYLQLVSTSDSGFPAAITGYAYESTGVGISVANISAVPEPASYVMFALGLAAVSSVSLRRRA